MAIAKNLALFCHISEKTRFRIGNGRLLGAKTALLPHSASSAHFTHWASGAIHFQACLKPLKP
jgi:hypothetical protein